MKTIIYNVETGETTIEEIPDVEMPIIEEAPQQTFEERLSALETLALQSEDII